MSHIFELIIIGAGPAGITASVYASRQAMDFLLLTQDIGGQAAWSGDIENYTGYQFISGPELVLKFQEHLKKYAIPLREGETVLEVKKEGPLFKVTTGRDVYSAKAVLIASGKKSKELNVPGEKEFKNKGVTYCAICDGPLFKGKNVAVIGGGNSALDAVLHLIPIAGHIWVVHGNDELRGEATMLKKVLGSERVTVYGQSRVTQISGEAFVTGIKVLRQNKEETLAVSGVFVEVGLVPNSQFAKDVLKNEKDEIKVNSFNQTNVEGIFGAGDVTDVPEKQIIVAAGEGAKALLGVFKYLKEKT